MSALFSPGVTLPTREEVSHALALGTLTADKCVVLFGPRNDAIGLPVSGVTFYHRDGGRGEEPTCVHLGRVVGPSALMRRWLGVSLSGPPWGERDLYVQLPGDIVIQLQGASLSPTQRQPHLIGVGGENGQGGITVLEGLWLRSDHLPVVMPSQGS